jgi:hypothetical protein
MSRRLPVRPRAANWRGGLSFLEFMGCFSAMIGGVAIGSMYLGIDLKATLLAVLNHAQTSRTAAPSAPSHEQSPAASAPELKAVAAPPGSEKLPQGEAQPPSATRQLPVSEPVRQPERQPLPPSAEPPSLTDVISLTEEQRRQLTEAYWAAVNQCMDREVTNRSSAVASSGEWDLYRYLTARHEGHLAAAEALGRLNRRGVDAHVSAYGRKAQSWHEEGAQLYARAKDLLTDAPTAQLSGPFAQSWQSAATQHHMEERLLAEKRAAVQAYLDHHGGEPSVDPVTGPRP